MCQNEGYYFILFIVWYVRNARMLAFQALLSTSSFSHTSRFLSRDFGTRLGVGGSSKGTGREATGAEENTCVW